MGRGRLEVCEAINPKPTPFLLILKITRRGGFECDAIDIERYATPSVATPCNTSHSELVTEFQGYFDWF